MREKFINPIFWRVKNKVISPPEFIEFEGQKIDILTDEGDFSDPYSVVISDDIEFLERADQQSARIFFYHQPINQKLISKLVNDLAVQCFFSADDSMFQLSVLIKLIIQKQKNNLSRHSVLKLMQKKNSELEVLTQNLEKIVDERTLYIEVSHKEEELKLKKERQLIRFIKDLADQLSVEDILSYIRKVLRPFHFVGAPILVIQKGRQIQVYYFGKTHYEKISRIVESDFKIDERNLANILGRPLLHLYQVDFLIQSKSDLINRAFLCIEVQQSNAELESFLEFLGDRIDAIKAALDRLMLEKEKEIYVQRWTNTFQNLQYPIAIIDQSGKILRSNQKIKDLDSEKHFEKMRFPFNSKDGEQLYLEIYIDRSDERLLYSQILQSEKLSAIGSLAGNLAHELNNPLTGIRSLVQLMKVESEPNSQILQDLTEIEKAAERSQRIIANLIEFAQGAKKTEQVNVDDLIQKTLLLLKSVLRQHRLTISLAAKKAFILIDPQLFQQVIFNLVQNACQAMEQTGDVAIQSYVREQQIFIEIVDTGPGIADQMKIRIFDPFFTTKPEGQGTGLGLFLVKQIVEKFSGKIQVKDQKPHGVRFILSFPKVHYHD